MRRIYIHDAPSWPAFEWDRDALAEPLAAVRLRQGRLIGHMEALGFPLRTEAVLQTLTSDVIKTSEIEGERLDADQVRSSIARKLGVDIGALKSADRDVEGVVEMMLDATRQYDRPLTASRLFGWHASLFPAGHSGLRKIKTGRWRDDSGGPMQVVSGPIQQEKVHFEAPAAARLPKETKQFLKWFNAAAHGDAGHCARQPRRLARPASHFLTLNRTQLEMPRRTLSPRDGASEAPPLLLKGQRLSCWVFSSVRCV